MAKRLAVLARSPAPQQAACRRAGAARVVRGPRPVASALVDEDAVGPWFEPHDTRARRAGGSEAAAPRMPSGSSIPSRCSPTCGLTASRAANG
jgi:hypothetical protein